MKISKIIFCCSTNAHSSRRSGIPSPMGPTCTVLCNGRYCLHLPQSIRLTFYAHSRQLPNPPNGFYSSAPAHRNEKMGKFRYSEIPKFARRPLENALGQIRANKYIFHWRRPPNNSPVRRRNSAGGREAFPIQFVRRYNKTNALLWPFDFQ